MRRPAVRRSARAARVLSRRPMRHETLESRQLLAGDPILINYQLGGAPVPTGYFADTGLVYANRGNGYSYGWNVDHTDFSRDRNMVADQRLDTLIHFHLNATWEIEVPNGLYDVTVSIGDPQSGSLNTVNVEGNNFWNALSLQAMDFRNDTQVVNVTDGRLTLDQGNLPDKSTKINYIDIVPLDDGPNTPPDTPVITEPNVDGKIVNPEDVHMEAPNFSDADGDLHSCTVWSVYTTDATPELAWQTPCLGGVEKVHTHQGDGVFQNEHEGRTSFFPNTDYQLSVRQRDDRGAFSLPGTRLFTTGAASSVFPLLIEDVLASPAPAWQTTAGTNVDLPAGATPSSLLLGGAGGEELLTIHGQAAAGNMVMNPGELAEHVSARIQISAGSNSLTLSETDLRFTDHEGDHTVYLPAINLLPGESAYFWISSDGSTFFGTAEQTEPDFSQLARTAPVPYAVAPGYEIEVVAEDFQLPTNIAFVPNPGDDPHDPFYYVTELYGNIKVVTRNGEVHDYATDLLNFDPTGNFPGSGEQGVTGIAVDPITGDVFAAYLYSSIPGVEAAPHYPKVVRFQSTDGGLTSSTQTTIRDMPGESMGQSHQISNVSIGPDGKLYVHVGDGFDAGTAQNLNSYRGKILRMNLDGTAPADNPFYNAANGISATDYVYAYGLRNPFGGAWRSSDGMHYQVENGPSVDRFAQVVRGRNYLWNGSDASMENFAIYNWSPAKAPTNIVFVEPETHGGSQFPADKQDHAFVAESGPTWGTGPQGNGKSISEFVLDENGELIGGPTTFVEYVGSGKGSVVALANGPDGLYFSEFYKDQDYQTPIDRGSRIFRVRFVGGADFEADITTGTPNLAVEFTDTSNMLGVTSWLWDFGDGETSTEQNPTHVYREEGSFSVTLRVTNESGASKVMEKHELIRVRTDSAPGLQGDYYNNINFTDLMVTRTDETIDFNWGNGSPDPMIGADSFSVRWTGSVTPEFTQTYTFYTISDDGIRLFVNNQLVIDAFVDQSPTEHSGQIALVAGQEYDIRVEYYENGGGAEARLLWSSASQPRQVVPGSRLSSGTPFNQPPRVLEAAGTGNGATFTFHESVAASLSLGDLVLVHETTGTVVLSGASLEYNDATDTATLSVPGLAAGEYTLTLLANGAAGGITDAAGARLDGDADNVGGDDFTFTFVIDSNCGALGDTNCDGEVDLDDLNNVRNNFGATGPGVLGDTNGDDTVDLDDLNNVRNNFGASAPAPVTVRLTKDVRVMKEVSAKAVDRVLETASDALFEVSFKETRLARLTPAKRGGWLERMLEEK
jgi:glucose/arabinose dehydrogenase/PKD repeat protein